MKKLQFKQTIQAPAADVYRTMLGLDSKVTYENWTAVFNPTSTYEGNWEKGSKILFVGTDEHGKRGGMVSQIVENKPSTFVSIRHIGFLDGDKEITTGEQVEKWAGSMENYRFEETQGTTQLTVEIDTIDDFVDYFNTMYPQALLKLKDEIER